MNQTTNEKLVGAVIDNFEIQDVIGQGGMGIVYRAYHPALQLNAAVKIMRPELASQAGFYERFLQEARTVARLEHPNIVDVINFGRFEDSYYLMMDFIQGPSLRKLIQENKGGLPIWDAVQIGWQIADVLVYSHAAGVLHRDLKPDNILITHSVRTNRPYRVIVTDFGLVKLGQGSLLETQEGISLGTPAYMSPEQCRGEEVDGRTDIYAMGVMLYEAITGKRPYPIRSVFDAARFHNSGKLVSLRALNSAVPNELDAIIRSMLAPDLSQRLAAATEATDELQDLMARISQVDGGKQISSLVRLQVLAEEMKEEALVAVEKNVTPTEAPPGQKSETAYFIKVAYQGNWEDKVYPLGLEAVIIGRLDTSDIVLDSPGQRYVSKRHCEILVRDQRVLIRDLGSTNGTLMGDITLQSNVFREWQPDVEVLLGPFTLALQTTQQIQAVPSPPVGVSGEEIASIQVTLVQSALKLSCPNAVPSRLPLGPTHPIVVGRGVDCDMVIEHPHVSKNHCRVQLSSEGVEVVDLRSTNGTFFGDQRLPPHTPVLWRKDGTLSIGPFELTLEDKT
jgi:serine/threonine protein kinase/pSer/pThr/pTyr-binding forkhead associated (FHA) protein